MLIPMLAIMIPLMGLQVFKTVQGVRGDGVESVIKGFVWGVSLLFTVIIMVVGVHAFVSHDRAANEKHARVAEIEKIYGVVVDGTPTDLYNPGLWTIDDEVRTCYVKASSSPMKFYCEDSNLKEISPPR